MIEDTNYTIAKIIGEPRSYPDKGTTRFAFTTNETGEQILSLFTKFPEAIKAGAPLWGHVEEQEKDGKTYFNFFFGKNNPNRKGGMSDADKERITNVENKVTTLMLRFNKLMSVLVEKDILEMPEPKKETIPGTSVEYPDSIAPEDIPFD